MTAFKIVPKYFFLAAFPAFVFCQDLIDGVAAIVGDKIILKSEVLQLSQMTALQNGIDPLLNPLLADRLNQQALEGMITQKILLAKAKIDSVDEIPSLEVDQALDQQIDNMIAQMGSEEKLLEVLGVKMREFRDDQWFEVRDRIIAERYQGQKISAISITRDEVITFFNTFRDSLPVVEPSFEVTQLIVPIVPGPEAQSAALDRAMNVRDKILEGEDFAAMARTISDDPSAAVRGGDLGFIRRGQLVPEFEAVAFNLDVDEISEIVETVFGYHIIQLLSRQGEKIRSRHILIKVSPSEDDRMAALEEIKSYFFQLEQEPVLFDTLVSDLSTKFPNINDLGYVGWVELGELPHPAYRSALFGIKSGDITPPFETPEGFHILKVLDNKEGGVPTLEEYYPQIESLALRQKQSITFEKWLKRVRNDIFIKVL